MRDVHGDGVAQTQHCVVGSRSCLSWLLGCLFHHQWLYPTPTGFQESKGCQGAELAMSLEEESPFPGQ